MKKSTSLAAVLIAVILTVLIGVIAFASELIGGPDESTVQTSGENVDREGINILVTGSDRTSGLTDVIMLVRADKDGSIAVMQIPRDTYAKYNQNGYKKLNGAYAALGGRKFKELLSSALAIKIDRYLMLSPDAFRDVVDALGGVEVELDRTFYYDDPYQNFTVHLTKGRHLLNGEKAEQFVRYRSGYVNGDLGRIDAQKIFLASALTKAAEELTPIRAISIATALIGNVDTDLTPDDIGFLTNCLGAIESDKIVMMTAPGEAVVAKKSGASFYSISALSTKRLIGEYFGTVLGEFDKDQLFLNEGNVDFRKIYFGESNTEIYRAEDIAK